MEVRERLASTLQGEAKAYGYTLTIWSNGALLSHTFGTPKPAEVFGYLFGGLLGFALLVGYTARSPFTVGMEASDDSDLVAGFLERHGDVYHCRGLPDATFPACDSVNLPCHTHSRPYLESRNL